MAGLTSSMKCAENDDRFWELIFWTTKPPTEPVPAELPKQITGGTERAEIGRLPFTNDQPVRPVWRHMASTGAMQMPGLSRRREDNVARVG